MIFCDSVFLNYSEYFIDIMFHYDLLIVCFLH